MKSLLRVALCTILNVIAGSNISAQHWTKEEKDFLDYFNRIWASFANQANSFTAWKNQVNPDEGLTWWWSEEGMPMDMNAAKTFLLNSEKAATVNNHFHARPVRIRIEGDIAMIWLYGYISQTDKQGKVFSYEDKRLEVFKKEGNGWKFLGGLVTRSD